MNPHLVALMAKQGGLVTRPQALDLGMSPPAIRACLRLGSWCPLHRGVYADAEVWTSMDPWRGQPLMRARAAVLAMKRAWVLSHDSAAHAHDLAMLSPRRPYAHITRPGHTNAWTKGEVKHHLARYRVEQVQVIEGHPTLDVARTVADVAREHGLRAGLVTADSALRSGLSRGDLWDAVDVMRHWPYITTVRTVVDLADGRAETAAESLGRELVVGMGLGDVDVQFPLRLSTGAVVWCDLRVGNQVIEVHGRIKVLTPDQGGVADRTARTVLFEERKRERLVQAEGLVVTNLYWEDFWGDARGRAVARVIADHQESVRRHGPDLPAHLVQQARELRERFGQRDVARRRTTSP